MLLVWWSALCTFIDSFLSLFLLPCLKSGCLRGIQTSSAPIFCLCSLLRECEDALIIFWTAWQCHTVLICCRCCTSYWYFTCPNTAPQHTVSVGIVVSLSMFYLLTSPFIPPFLPLKQILHLNKTSQDQGEALACSHDASLSCGFFFNVAVAGDLLPKHFFGYWLQCYSLGTFKRFKL